MGIGLCLYGFTINCALEEATWVYISYMYKKTRLLKSHCIGYEYFKDSLIVHTDVSYLDLIVAFSNKNN